ncbi:MAG TPA: Rieske 2Fe-2S domain-containing protein [Thermoanaerobaculia bacterium]|nr:Rieske 2Fe-2S domain-containing protein [Thermoanaerobaculia bacterium]
MNAFANSDVVCEGWYVIASAKAIRRGAIVPAQIGKRNLAVFRDANGALHAVDRACPHLGADLTKGTVTGSGVQCVFHGRCVKPGYAVRERWGLVWIWAGASPAYELPSPEPQNEHHVLRLPPQRIGCHAHVVLGNGLDLTHVTGVHGFRFEETPAVELEPPHRLSVSVHTRFFPTALRRVLGLANQTARWRFTTIGPSLAWVKVTAPTPFELVWAARPLPDGTCATQTLFFLPRLRALLRAVPMMIATTIADRHVLDGLDFRRGFVASDAVFERYVKLIDAMPAWR